MFSWNADIFVLRPLSHCEPMPVGGSGKVARTMLNVMTFLNDISPFLCAFTKFL